MSIFDRSRYRIYEKIREVREELTVSIHRAASPAIPRTEHATDHYDTDPARMENLNAIIHRELKSIAENGPRTEDCQQGERVYGEAA
jgi:zinc protease